MVQPTYADMLAVVESDENYRIDHYSGAEDTWTVLYLPTLLRVVGKTKQEVVTKIYQAVHGDPLTAPAEVRVVKRGRFSYNIKIHEGLTVSGSGYGGCVIGWNRYGEKRARRKARKELEKYLARESDSKVVYRLNTDELDGRV